MSLRLQRGWSETLEEQEWQPPSRPGWRARTQPGYAQSWDSEASPGACSDGMEGSPSQEALLVAQGPRTSCLFDPEVDLEAERRKAKQKVVDASKLRIRNQRAITAARQESSRMNFELVSVELAVKQAHASGNYNPPRLVVAAPKAPGQGPGSSRDNQHIHWQLQFVGGDKAVHWSATRDLVGAAGCVPRTAFSSTSNSPCDTPTKLPQPPPRQLLRSASAARCSTPSASFRHSVNGASLMQTPMQTRSPRTSTAGGGATSAARALRLSAVAPTPLQWLAPGHGVDQGYEPGGLESSPGTPGSSPALPPPPQRTPMRASSPGFFTPQHSKTRASWSGAGIFASPGPGGQDAASGRPPEAPGSAGQQGQQARGPSRAGRPPSMRRLLQQQQQAGIAAAVSGTASGRYGQALAGQILQQRTRSLGTIDLSGVIAAGTQPSPPAPLAPLFSAQRSLSVESGDHPLTDYLLAVLSDSGPPSDMRDAVAVTPTAPAPPAPPGPEPESSAAASDEDNAPAVPQKRMEASEQLPEPSGAAVSPAPMPVVPQPPPPRPTPRQPPGGEAPTPPRKAPAAQHVRRFVFGGASALVTSGFGATATSGFRAAAGAGPDTGMNDGMNSGYDGPRSPGVEHRMLDRKPPKPT